MPLIFLRVPFDGLPLPRSGHKRGMKSMLCVLEELVSPTIGRVREYIYIAYLSDQLSFNDEIPFNSL